MAIILSTHSVILRLACGEGTIIRVLDRKVRRSHLSELIVDTATILPTSFMRTRLACGERIVTRILDRRLKRRHLHEVIVDTATILIAICMTYALPLEKAMGITIDRFNAANVHPSPTPCP